MRFELLETGKKPAQIIMDLDAKLLDDLDPKGPGLLHLYEWEGLAATYGHFIKFSDLLSAEGVKKHGLTLGKRPTGGGIVLHVSDLAFSVLVPSGHEGFHQKTLDNYAFINHKVKRAILKMLSKESLELLPEDPLGLDGFCKNFCMAKPTIYDVMLGGKKVAGAAQRKKKQGYLHQGSISIGSPSPELLQDILPKNSKVYEAMLLYTYTLLKSGYSKEELDSVRYKMKQALKQEFLAE